MVPEKAGWYPDSDRLGERYWNCEAWDGFRVRNRDLGFVIGLLIWVYFPIAMVWVAEFGPHFRHPSVGLREASAVIGLLTLIPIARALTQAVTITSAGVADRGILRTRRYPLARIEDAFMRETGLGPRLLVLRLGSEKLVTLGDLDSPPEVLRVYLSQIRALLPTAPALDRSLVRPPERQVVARQRAHGARYVPRALRSARVAVIAVDRPGNAPLGTRLGPLPPCGIASDRPVRRAGELSRLADRGKRRLARAPIWLAGGAARPRRTLRGLLHGDRRGQVGQLRAPRRRRRRRNRQYRPAETRLRTVVHNDARNHAAW